MTWIKKGNIFNKEWAQLPVVESYPDSYKIYYSTRDEQGRSRPKYIQVYKDDFTDFIGKSVEIDIPLGKPGSFDSHGIMLSSIVTLEDGTKYMYYVGWSKRIDVPYWNSTGLAISKDNGITWKKYSEGPIFTSGPKEPGFIGTVEVIKRGPSNWFMIYSSAHWGEIDGKQECIYDFKDARSYDGINWIPMGGSVLPLLKGEGGIAAPRIIKDGDYAWEMYFSVRSNQDYRTNPKKSYKIKKAYSTDLINWTRENNQSEYLQPQGKELMNAYPYIIQEKDRDIMFMNTDFGKSGISYAIKIK